MSDKWTQGEKDAAVEMRNDGESLKAIAEALGRSVAQTWKVIEHAMNPDREEDRKSNAAECNLPNLTNGTIAAYMIAKPDATDEQAAEECEVPISTIRLVRRSIEYYSNTESDGDK